MGRLGCGFISEAVPSTDRADQEVTSPGRRTKVVVPRTTTLTAVLCLALIAVRGGVVAATVVCASLSSSFGVVGGRGCSNNAESKTCTQRGIVLLLSLLLSRAPPAPSAPLCIPNFWPFPARLAVFPRGSPVRFSHARGQRKPTELTACTSHFPGVQFGTTACRRCETVGPRHGHPRCFAAVPRGGCTAVRRASAVGFRRVTKSAPRPVRHADGRSHGLGDSPRVTTVQVLSIGQTAAAASTGRHAVRGGAMEAVKVRVAWFCI